MPVARVPCGLFVVSAWWTVPFLLASVWGSRFPVLLFILLGPDLSLSQPFLLQPLAPGAFLVGAFVCLSYLRSLDCPSPSPGGIPVGIPSFLYGYLPVALSHLPGGVQLFCFPLAPFQSVFLVCPGRWLLFLALSSAFCQVIDRRLLSSLWFGWCSATFPAALHPASLFGLLAVPLFLLSGLVAVCFPGLWVSLFPCRLPRPGLLFPGSRHLQLPPLWGTRGGIWILPFCSSGVLHPTLSHGLSLVSVSWDGFSERSVGSKVFSPNFLTLVSVGFSPV